MVGGYTPDKIALRRAIGMAIQRRRRDPRAGARARRSPATQPMPPGVSGPRPELRRAHAKYDPAAAKALLDKFGYVDRDKDGWRELPDGKPLVLEDRGTSTVGARPAVRRAVEAQA